MGLPQLWNHTEDLSLSSPVLVTFLIKSKYGEGGRKDEDSFGFLGPEGADRSRWPHALEWPIVVKVSPSGPSSHCGPQAGRDGEGTGFAQEDSSLFLLCSPSLPARPTSYDF